MRGDSNVADHLSRIQLEPAIDVASLGSFISVFDKSALRDHLAVAQQSCQEPWFVDLRA